MAGDPWRMTAAACLAALAVGCGGRPQSAARPSANSPSANGSSAGRIASGSRPRPASSADIRTENARRGDPGWPITHAGPDAEIEGFADHVGARPGTPVRLFVSTTARSFRVRAYRFGWYGGALARQVWVSADTPGRRRPGRVVRARGMVVAPWRPSVTVPTAGWPPGSYLLRLEAASGGQRYVPLVIDSPSVAGRVVLIQAVTSYQAYNGWGGADLYNGPDGEFATRSRAVSFDRPYQSEHGAANFFQLEQPLVELAERLGLPVAYATSVDLDRNGHALDGAVVAVSEGHDEYWSPAMRATLTRARDHGTNIAFFGANAIYRKIRFEASAQGSDRVEVNYKDPTEDPLYGRDNALVTGDWPKPPAADPETSLTGQAYACFSRAQAPMVVTDPKGWIWTGTGVRRGQSLPGVVGPESDHVSANGPTPRGLVVLAHSPITCAFGGSTSADATYYAAPSGAGVFDSGTEGWVCALRAGACRQTPPPPVRRVIQTATGTILRTFARGPAGPAPRPPS